MSYVLSFRMVFFYLSTTGWIFDISLCENSVNQTISLSVKNEQADAGRDGRTFLARRNSSSANGYGETGVFSF